MSFLGRKGSREGAGGWTQRVHVMRPAIAALTLMVLALPYFAGVVQRTHNGKRAAMGGQLTFAEAVSRLPARQAVVFVRYAPAHNADRSVIANDPDLGNACVWVVYDRGADNERLLRTAPNRVAYLFDEARGVIVPYALNGASASLTKSQ